MKKKYTKLSVLVLALVLSHIAISQTTTNFHGVQDNLWSNSNNWNNGVPSLTSTVNINNNAVLDVETTIKELRVSDYSLTGSDTLTCDYNSANNNSIAINMNQGVSSEIGIPVIINNSSGGRSKIKCTGSPRTITFNADSSIKLITTGEFAAGADNTINMNGALLGSDVLRLDDVVNFGTTSDNSGFTGSIQLLQPADVTVSTTIAGGFLPESADKLQVNGNATVTLDTPDVLRSLINFSDAKNLILNVNADQPSIGTIAFVGSGTFTLNVGVGFGVTNISFDNSSALDWKTGSLNITGFEAGAIRFGTDNTGLTASQLAVITADGDLTGKSVALDASGYLVDAGTLSVNTDDKNNSPQFFYPSLVATTVNFYVPQDEVKIFNISGQLVKEVYNTSAINVADLKTGVYYLVLADGKSAKFVKK